LGNKPKKYAVNPLLLKQLDLLQLVLILQREMNFVCLEEEKMLPDLLDKHSFMW